MKHCWNFPSFVRIENHEESVFICMFNTHGLSKSKIYATNKTKKVNNNSLLATQIRQTANIIQMVDSCMQGDQVIVVNFFGCDSHQGVSDVVEQVYHYIRIFPLDGHVLFIGLNVQHQKSETPIPQTTSVGFYQLLQSDVFDAHILQQISNAPICVIPPGENVNQIEKVYTKKRFFRILSECKKLFKYIFIDSPALNHSIGTLITAQSADCNFLVIRSGTMHLKAVDNCKKILQLHQCNIHGVVLTGVKQVIPRWLYKRL